MVFRYMVLFFLVFFSLCKKKEEVSSPNIESQDTGISYADSSHVDYGSAIYYIVIAKGGLKLREESNLKAKMIELIPEGDIVEFLEEAGEEITVEDKTKRFYKVNWQDKTGYVFGGFLDEGKENSTGVSDSSQTNGYRIFPDSKKVMSPNGTRYYHQLTLNNPTSFSLSEKSCNHKYSGIYCYVVVYETETNRLLYSKMVHSGYWDKWNNEEEILIQSDFGDEGSSWNGYTTFQFKKNKILLDVTVFKIVEINEKGVRTGSEEDRIVYYKDKEYYSVNCQNGKFIYGTIDSIYSKNVNVIKTMSCSSLTFPEKYDGMFFELDGDSYQILENKALRKL